MELILVKGVVHFTFSTLDAVVVRVTCSSVVSTHTTLIAAAMLRMLVFGVQVYTC